MNASVTLTQVQDLVTRYAVVILVIFHTIGIGLFLYPDRPVGLSGLNILLCTTLVFLSSKDYQRELLALLTISLGGFSIEAVGINTGLLFGTYSYGNELGWEFMGVSLVMGFNWYCVVALGSHVMRHWLPGRSLFLQAFLAGLVAMGLDFLIEPVAMHYDFWDWEGGIVPLFNYICWWIFATIFATGYLSVVPSTNKTALSLLGIWVIFFGLLNIVVGLS